MEKNNSVRILIRMHIIILNNKIEITSLCNSSWFDKNSKWY